MVVIGFSVFQNSTSIEVSGELRQPQDMDIAKEKAGSVLTLPFPQTFFKHK